MTSFNPFDPEPHDSLPGHAPTEPADMALWNDADMRVMRGPAAAFADTIAGEPDPAPAIPTIGHIGRYALKHQLGEGGIGTVYAAHDPLLSRLIAVKTLHVEVLESERVSFNTLFLNEAKAAGGLSHPHIVTVFDAGISDDRAYIAMELLKGRDLRQLRQEGWRATPLQAAVIVRRVADALGYAHSKGVVHRDVKPANIFMIGRTQPKVLDFGIARITHSQESHGTGGDIAAGSPYYMAPEQVRQEVVDRRADVFSLGVVLYELLTDLKPFRGATLDEITTAVLNHEPPLANVVAPAVPAALAAITAKALAKDPEQRYRSARAFSRDLRHWLDENTPGVEGEGPAAASRRRGPAVLALAALAAVGLGAALWLVLVAPRAQPASADVAALAPAVTAAPTLVGALAPGAVADGAASPPALAAEKPAPVPAKPAPAAVAAVAAKEPKETAAARRLRESAERRAQPAAAGKAAKPAAPATGTLRIAISPWGEVEVDGAAVGTSPPLTELRLAAGRHQIVVRNTDLPPHSAVVHVSNDQPVVFKHKF